MKKSKEQSKKENIFKRLENHPQKKKKKEKTKK